ncbi:MAG: hypothetical protein QXL15_00750 [Candidatus Korarchaeota archaeon]
MLCCVISSRKVAPHKCCPQDPEISQPLVRTPLATKIPDILRITQHSSVR